MTGHDAFDELVRDGFMQVNEAGWACIVKAPKSTRELDRFVRLVKTLGSWSTNHDRRGLIEVTRTGDPDRLAFRKKAEKD